MASNNSSLLFVFLSLLVVSTVYKEASALESPDHPKHGGWTPIKNLKDPLVIKVAEFAVTEHNEKAKPKTNVTFVDVLRGDKQVVAGLNFRLWINATDGSVDGKGKYLAIVYYKPWGHESMELLSFSNVKYGN